MNVQRLYRRFAALTAAAVLALSGCGAPDITEPSAPSQSEYEKYTEASAREQNSFRAFTNELFCEEVSADQITLHYSLADPAARGITGADSAFGEASSEALRRDMEDTERVHRELTQFDRSLLSESQQLTYDILNSYLNTALTGKGLELYSRPLAPTIGVQAQLPILLAEYPFYTEKDVEDYLSILSQIDVYYGELEEFEREKAAAGLYYSDGTIDRLIESCESYLIVPQENFLTETFAEKLDGLTGVSQEEKAAWKRRHTELIAEHFVPAYQSLIETLTSLKGTGTNEIGMCGFPQGKEYYEYLVRMSTRTSYASVDELTDAVTRRIDEDAAAMANELTAELYLEMLSYSFSETEPDAILADLKVQTKQEFPELPECSCTIKAVPEALELSLSPAFYLTPPMDRFQDNVIYINGSEEYAGTPLYTTLAHEGYPGHLYQTVYFSSVCDDPIRHLLSFPAYTEGWATYVEFQSYFFDNGLSPELQNLLMRNQAVTLGIHALLDLNINYYGWTRDQTAAFLEETYGITDRETSDRMFDAMVDNPSNYLEYYVGWLEIQQMREQAEETLGSSFDPMEFHTFLLDLGPAPFTVIRAHFQSWLVTAPLTQGDLAA